jgi:hypothetical protein
MLGYREGAEEQHVRLGLEFYSRTSYYTRVAPHSEERPSEQEI